MDYSERLPIVDDRKMPHAVHRFFEVASVDKAFFVLGLDLIALALQLIAATILLSFYHPILLGFTFLMALTSWLVVRVPFNAALRRSIEESEAKYALAAFIDEKRDDELARLSRFNRWEEARSAAENVFGSEPPETHLLVLFAMTITLLGVAVFRLGHSEFPTQQEG